MRRSKLFLCWIAQFSRSRRKHCSQPVMWLKKLHNPKTQGGDDEKTTCS
jgi:hypothetical protein